MLLHDSSNQTRTTGGAGGLQPPPKIEIKKTQKYTEGKIIFIVVDGDIKEIDMVVDLFFQ
jgi:hypothetical protein